MAQTKSKSCNKFDSFKIVTIKKRMKLSMKLSIFSLKTEILLEILSLGSKLFHSIIADGKKEYGVLLTGIRIKRYFECSFLKTL